MVQRGWPSGPDGNGAGTVDGMKTCRNAENLSFIFRIVLKRSACFVVSLSAAAGNTVGKNAAPGRDAAAMNEIFSPAAPFAGLMAGA